MPLPVLTDDNEFADLIPKPKRVVPPPLSPMIAASDATAVRPKPPQAPDTSGGSVWDTMRKVNAAVRKAIVPDAVAETEQGLTKLGTDTGKSLVALDPGKAPKAEDYPDAESYAQAQRNYAEKYMKGFAAIGAQAGVPEVKTPIPDVPFNAYSRLESAVAKAPFETGTAEQWAAALKPNVAAGERDWRGIDQLLQAKQGQPVTKAELQQHLAENPINIARSQYGGKIDAEAKDATNEEAFRRGYTIRAAPGDNGPYVVVHPDGVGINWGNTREEAEAWMRAHAGLDRPRAKFESYKEPGGENYTENVLTLNPPKPTELPEGYKVEPTYREVYDRDAAPANTMTPEEWVAAGRPRLLPSRIETEYHVVDNMGREVPNSNWGDPETAKRRAIDTLQPKAFTQPGHFPDKNPLAHYRYTDHVLPNGEKVRFLEEIQSDWHQQGRKYGYRKPEGANYTVAPHPTRPNNFTVLGPDGKPLMSGGPQGTDPVEYFSQKGAADAAATLEKHSNAVPDAPFKKTEEWTELALKDAIDKAHRDGIDRIAWTTGDQQAARYDLSKHVDRITYTPGTGGLTAWRDGHAIHQGVYDQRALPDVIGKEAAENLMKPENAVNQEGEPAQVLEGEDLKVGGAGMRAYYDRMVPKVVQDYGKKMGVKLQIEPVQLFGEGQGGGFEGPVHTPRTVDRLARALEQEDPEDPIAMSLRNIETMMRSRPDIPAHRLIDAELSNTADEIDPHAAEMVAEELGGIWRPPSENVGPNQSFSLHPLRGKGPQPLWAAGAAGAAAATALQTGTKKKPVITPDNEFADLVPKQDSSSSQNEFDDLIPKRPPYLDPTTMSAPSRQLTESFNAALHPAPKGPVPSPMIAAADAARVRADRPLPTEHLPGQSTSRAENIMENAGEMVTHPVQTVAGVARPFVDLGYNLRMWTDPHDATQRNRVLTSLKQAIAISGASAAEAFMAPLVGGGAAKLLVGAAAGSTFTPEDPLTGAIMGAGAVGVHAVPELATDIASKVAGDPFKGAVEAGANALTPSGPPVDQPQPLTRPQEILRARLATEGITPAGPITRRPAPVEPAPVEPPPEAQTYSTKGAVRRPAAAAAPVETPPQPAVERRAEPNAPRPVWTPEERAAYLAQSQKTFAAGINKPWSQWTPEEKDAYFADQARVLKQAPWQVEVEAARQMVGDDEFKRRATEAASQATGDGKLAAIQQVAHDIVNPPEEAVTWPPAPKPGDIQPVAATTPEGVEARPGVMSQVNREEPALPSPLRLPEPTPEDRAIVQPKGYKEVTPEEVAARKPAEPVVTAEPKGPAPATVDESGLFFEHRTPSGTLRDFPRVSTEGLVRAYREQLEQLQRDQQASIYRTIENENMSGTGENNRFQAATRTSRGTSAQAEAAQRVRNYQKVLGRLDQELAKRGVDVRQAIQDQEEHEAAIEQEAIHHANAEDEADTAFGDFEDLVPDEDMSTKSARNVNKNVNPPASDILNVAKLNLGSKTAEQRMAEKLEQFRSQRDANKQTYAEADVNRAQILNELRAGDPLALPTEKAKKLSGEELLARRDLVRENDQTIAALSKQMEAGMPPEAYQQAAQLVQRATEHNDALLSDLVSGSSQKGRDLNLLRRMANQSLDPAVWRVQAKRMLGDRPLTAEVDATIRKLIQEAEDACQ